MEVGVIFERNLSSKMSKKKSVLDLGKKNRPRPVLLHPLTPFPTPRIRGFRLLFSFFIYFFFYLIKYLDFFPVKKKINNLSSILLEINKLSCTDMKINNPTRKNVPGTLLESNDRPLSHFNSDQNNYPN